jgi:hypothetical protein
MLLYWTLTRCFSETLCAIRILSRAAVVPRQAASALATLRQTLQQHVNVIAR